MRFINMFLLYLQQVLEQRSYMLVFFLMSLVNPLIYVLFWQGATTGGKVISPGWDFSAIVSYYFYFALLNGLLVAHPEYSVSQRDIKDGYLSMALLRPLPYFVQIFLGEFSWRFIRFWFGIFTIILFYIFWHNQIIALHNSFLQWILIAIIFFLGFMVGFVMKMILGISALWFVDTRGLFDLMEVIMMIFAGFILPLELLPQGLNTIATNLPFAYIIYFPVLALEGKFEILGLLHIILLEIVWICILYLGYHVLWQKGLKKFTAVGQ